MVKINGEIYELENKTVLEYLNKTSYQLERIAVERNGEIVPKALYDATILQDGDCLEIVSFVGGG